MMNNKKQAVDFELSIEEDEFLGYSPGDVVITQKIEDGIIFYKKGVHKFELDRAALDALQSFKERDSSEVEFD